MIKQKTNRRIFKLISFKKISSTKIVSKEIYTDKYLYPIHDEVLRTLIEGTGGFQHTDDYLEEYDEDFLEILTNYKQILGNGCLNPYKYYKLPEYYVKSESFHTLGVIIKYRNRPNIKKNIVHEGDKGSGKTALQNCWLYENNTLLEENNIFWIRCDGHKLYQLWLNCIESIEDGKIERGEDRVITIEEYLDLQLVYVFAKYCMSEKRPFLKKMFSKIKENNVTFDFPMGKYEVNKTEKRDLYLTILEIRRIILKVEKEMSGIKRDYSYLIDDVMKISFVSHQREKRRWLAVSHKLQNVLFNNGYFLLKIVDGVDNVHINELNTARYYRLMINECHSYITDRPMPNEIRFIALRERTKIDIGRVPITNTSPHGIGRKIIKHKASCLKKISIKRYVFFREDIQKNTLFEKIFKVVSYTIHPLTRDLHHNNVRTFLYNKCTLISQVYYRAKQLRGNLSNLKSIVNHLDKRNKYLNGRLFLDTFHDFPTMNSELGLCCMNIFYFNLDQYPCNCSDKWYGLCKTRILQMLQMHTSIEENDLTLYLTEGLEYPESLVKADVADLRAFGMIDSKMKADQLVYIISPKGEKYLDKSFSDVDTLYYFALDTPLPVNFVENGLVNSHNNSLGHRTDFPYAAISTTATFIKFLSHINSVENNKFNLNKNKLKNKKLRYPINLSIPISDKFIYKQLVESGKFYVNASDKTNIDNINIFIDKANAFFNPQC